ncbi:imidazoleglycerol-phosphate synthase [Thermanaerovibrio velox DSM 12556]|uniref:imidazole glycerol-phosphate synthase n=1 Tax=Thermanaerovibrio velox DSM 12556 TaxID=926567 RepID=H0USF7_9BACT|nr:imidazole glycerol phosphate synthase cyclase subunit [Thermanaerovibrio velox]EHM10246.1 imidazoleglycerol-phosphate synthase [Thermanaerovibrio velox DSM 12556]
MMAKRIIPQFLLKGERLVKGTRFGEHVDVGDPISQAMIQDAQGADEIVLVDITASKEGRTVDTSLVRRLAERCRLPIAVGGGVRSVKDAANLFLSGADKVIVNTACVLDPGLVRRLAERFGSQSVVASVDVRGSVSKGWMPMILSGSQEVNVDLVVLLEALVENGAGEVVLTSIDREGTLSGFDLDLMKLARQVVPVNLIASGGAGSYLDLVDLFRSVDLEGVGIGKMLSLRDYDVVRIKAFLKGRDVPVREA